MPHRPPGTCAGAYRAHRLAGTDIRDATSFAPGCPQPPSPFTSPVTSEDCLYMNVYAPARSRNCRGR
jgi:carboxylesterase type B